MKVIIEIKIAKGLSEKAILDSSTDLEKVGLNLDKAYKPVHLLSCKFSYESTYESKRLICEMII